VLRKSRIVLWSQARPERPILGFYLSYLAA